ARGETVGLIKVRLYRPWAPEYLRKVMPRTVKRLAVLDRTKEPGAVGDPLYTDIRAMYYGEAGAPEVYGGRYGLGSKDTTPGQIAAVFRNLQAERPKDHFTIGIIDDVTFTSLSPVNVVTERPDTIRCKFWGLGSDGTVGANKQAIKIIGDTTDLYVQGYFSYDSKKSGGLTVSHLRFGTHPIRSAYLVTEADFVACHNQSYVYRYDVLKGLKPGGTFVLNCSWPEEEIKHRLPAAMRRYLVEHDIEFYTIDAVAMAKEIGLGNRINMIMQAAFFRLIGVIPPENAAAQLKRSVETTYRKKGETVVRMNREAVDRGMNGLRRISVNRDWLEDEEKTENAKGQRHRGGVELPEFISRIVVPMIQQEGDSLPVSAFCGREDGTFPPGTAAFEKRGIAVNLPQWQPENCIQCNQCSFVCPHATIRPFLLEEGEAAAAPRGFVTVAAKGGRALAGYRYRVQVSPLDCTGCGNCADICPAPRKALIMKPFATENEGENWAYAMGLPLRDGLADKGSVKGSQFARPYLEFSGACAGCGETPYIKVITQLFGDRMMIANATGCSSIWGASAPSMPYTKDEKGCGPSWANSLFEDNAEYGLGMAVGVRQLRDELRREMERLLAMDVSEEVRTACERWIAGMDDGEETRQRANRVIEVLEELTEGLREGNVGRTEAQADCAAGILKRRDFLAKRSVWCVGGDGWAYDIGYGGVDHVLASGEDINLLIFDTEVYSNTGGQASKATPAAAVAKFAASGKRSAKKDLGRMAMSYGTVYVAQVGMSADNNQFMKAIREAESYRGPSLILCYAPCISHGWKKGMGRAQQSIREAVACGYWQLYRFDPRKKQAGQNPFTLDSKEPTADFREFLMSQIRYSALAAEFPERAEELFTKAEADARERLEEYRRLAARGTE
ncbi:MAG: pyruvate:ferredoxin (flavodoxin) oxidoreductase, partial [Firmicutes bacterium]|nr:pyruvate:ferredoxin (flavodoxin) oxidoreductase [Bacillota bacterium]